MRRVLLFCATGVVLSVIFSKPAAAQFLFRKIVDLNTPIPNGDGNFTDINAPQIFDNIVYFVGWGENNQRGIYTWDGTSYGVVADTNTRVEGHVNPLTGPFGLPAVDNGQVAFRAAGGDHIDGVYLRAGSEIQSVVERDDFAPGTTNEFSSFPGVAIRDGNVAFVANWRAVNGEGILLSAPESAEPIKIVDGNTINPTTGEKFQRSFGDSLWQSSDGRTVTFVAPGGIYQSSSGGPINVIADTTTAIPEGGGERFQSLGHSRTAAQHNDTIVFTGYGAGGALVGVYVSNGSDLQRVVDTTMQAPDTDLRFGPHGGVGIHSGNVVFESTPQPSPPSVGFDLYARIDGEILPVIKSGTELGGKRLTYPYIFGQSIEGSSVVFAAVHQQGCCWSERYALYRADRMTLPPQPRVNSMLTDPPSERNLVIITHGRNTDLEKFNGWVRGMESAIEGHIGERGEQNDWAVVAYNWTDDSHGLYYKNARAHGEALGAQLANLDYDHIHFVGHSAGARLITAAAEKVQLLSASTSIHLTYLDAFVPRGDRPWYGRVAKNAAWAEHYFNRDIVPSTQTKLRQVYNVDITGLVKPDNVEDHSWPRVFYSNTITADSRYGFPLSREAGFMGNAWNPGGVEDYAVNQTIRLTESAPMPSRRSVPPLSIRQDPVLAIDSLPIATEGTVAVAGNQINLQSASPAWLAAGIVVDEPVNLMTFSIEFTSQPRAEGLLAVYWDDAVLATIDERFALAGDQEYILGLPESEPGYHVVAFRLDPFSAESSSVSITNINTGYVFASSLLLSDLTGNGFVDFADLTLLLANWNKNVGSEFGNVVDPTNSPVNFADLTLLLADWTGPAPGPSPEAASAAEAVPEPSARALAAVALMWMVTCYRLRRARRGPSNKRHLPVRTVLASRS
ncbi:MAG: hypothetical protein IID44_03725 [Planctomycetes bacterium]|nr:hypothetical protein [Planctomycetota bacterium]